ncbi:NAD(P)/FAD-dependent oxidoreductase [Maribacter sp. 2304DJ31-5]|uniref:NAD(P)/FAD-dependent oxidoreductase n=1 Tax=Maribacter sp. 2304DJ31-5 TaxID=3386273 RepID=UPI0039BD3ED3
MKYVSSLTVNLHDVIIIGGGLAGLTAAIHLADSGHDVVLFESKEYPHHKVCGEYVSNEILPYLERLGVDVFSKGAIRISNFEISSVKGRKVAVKLPLGGFGMSRFAFDHLLYQKAIEKGVQCYFEKVTGIAFIENQFTIRTHIGKSYYGKVAIGAYGKRSALDRSLNRNFIFDKNSWLAVKSHYRSSGFPETKVALHNFEGGYGGLSKTESGAVNFCYLAHYDSFKKYQDVERFNKVVVSQNPHLGDFLKKSEPLFNSPMTIAQISFGKKEPVIDHMLMCGDTAGLIHPLCGNGMAMAIHSAKLASECIHEFLTGEKLSRAVLEKTYTSLWSDTFKKRLWFGRKLQNVLLSKQWTNLGVRAVSNSTSLLKYIITKTHGKPIT